MAASETSDSRPLKRKCIFDDSHQSPTVSFTPAPATCSTTVWLHDGNVILHVENTLFRVHQSFLAANSLIFDDMFKVGQPGSGDLVEGCPVVRMHDALGDWETLLTTIYYPMKIHPSQKDLSPAHLISLLRLGKKYQFDRIFEEALARLKSEFPQTIEAYDAMFPQSHQNGALQCKRQGTKPCPYMGCATWSLFDLTNIMLEVDIATTLPIAYYMCAIRPSQIIFNGCPRPDNTIAKLSPHAQSIVFSGRDEINNARGNMKWLYGTTQDRTVPSRQCRDDDNCSMVSLNIFKHLKRGLTTSDGHPLHPVFDIVFNGFCDKCKRAKDWHQDERIEFWRRLPNYFNLSDWTDLSN